VLAALGAEDYDLAGAIEKTTPIGCKLVFTKWSNGSGDHFWSADLVYQTTEQLRNTVLLDLNNPPAICHLSFDGIRLNDDGLYKDEDFRGLIKDAIGEYYRLYTEYVEKAA
jgi:glucose-1-phosphatase